MHGIVFSEVKKLVVSKHAHAGWKAVTEKAGLAHKVYLAAGQYPDSEIVSLVTAASAITGQEPFLIVEAFGEFIVPSLLKMYGHLLKPDWKSLEVIEHTEGTVHTVVRTSDKNAQPPKLRSRRDGPDTVILVYDSPRKMCALAVGIGKGLARRFRETLSISQTQCMLKGASYCEIVYRKTGKNRRAPRRSSAFPHFLGLSVRSTPVFSFSYAFPVRIRVSISKILV